MITDGMMLLLGMLSLSLVTAVPDLITCMDNPSLADCSGILYPDVNTSKDLDLLCSSMPNMIGCSLRELCSKNKVTGRFCNAFSLLGDICLADTGMSMMNGCQGYNALCRKDSVVEQCSSDSPLNGILTTEQATADTLALCAEMNMPGCENCASESECPDPLGTISQLCLSMEMDKCSNWKFMCKNIKEFGESDNWISLCGGTSSGQSTTPLMRMYFHTGIVEYVLFKEWVPTSIFEYVLAFLAIVLMGISSVFFKILRQYFDELARVRDFKKLSPSNSPRSPLLVQDLKPSRPKSLWKAIFPTRHKLGQNTVRMFFAMIIVSIDYALMLVAMTFNVGLFFAVVLGLGLGTLFFGHGLFYMANPEGECCG